MHLSGDKIVHRSYRSWIPTTVHDLRLSGKIYPWSVCSSSCCQAGAVFISMIFEVIGVSWVASVPIISYTKSYNGKLGSRLSRSCECCLRFKPRTRRCGNVKRGVKNMYQVGFCQVRVLTPFIWPVPCVRPIGHWFQGICNFRVNVKDNRFTIISALYRNVYLSQTCK